MKQFKEKNSQKKAFRKSVIPQMSPARMKNIKRHRSKIIKQANDRLQEEINQRRKTKSVKLSKKTKKSVSISIKAATEQLRKVHFDEDSNQVH